MAIDRKIFFQEAAKAPFASNGYKLGQAQKEGIGYVLDEWEKTPNPGDLEGLAYVLASELWETGGRMQPIIETTGPRDKAPVSVDTAIARLEAAFARGQLPWVKKIYWRKDANGRSWLGRGGVQNTHEANYKKLAKRHGVPLDTNPDMILEDPRLDARITVFGHIEGIWTGKKLDSYRGKPYHLWRPIVNADGPKGVPGRPGVTYGSMIGGFAYDFGSALNKASSTRPAPVAPPVTAGSVGFLPPKPEDEPQPQQEPEQYEPEIPVQATTTTVDPVLAKVNRIKAVQKDLFRVGLHPGDIDGSVGPNTLGAIAVFRTKFGLGGDPKDIDELLEIKLREVADGYFKPLPERAAATAEVAASKSETVEKISVLSRMKSRALEIKAAILGLVGLDAGTDIFGFFTGRWEWVTGKLAMVPTWVWFALAIAVYLAWRHYEKKTQAVAVDAFKRGDIIGGDKAPPGPPTTPAVP